MKAESRAPEVRAMAQDDAETRGAGHCTFCEHNAETPCSCQPCGWVRQQWPDLLERHAAERHADR